MKAAFTSPRVLTLQFETEEELSGLLHVTTIAGLVATEAEDMYDCRLPPNPGWDVIWGVLSTIYERYCMQFPRKGSRKLIKETT